MCFAALVRSRNRRDGRGSTRAGFAGAHDERTHGRGAPQGLGGNVACKSHSLPGQVEPRPPTPAPPLRALTAADPHGAPARDCRARRDWPACCSGASGLAGVPCALRQAHCAVRDAVWATLSCVSFADSALAALKLSPGPLQVPLYKRAGEQQAPPLASTPCPKLRPGTP